MEATQKSVILHTGAAMPIIGYGTSEVKTKGPIGMKIVFKLKILNFIFS